MCALAPIDPVGNEEDPDRLQLELLVLKAMNGEMPAFDALFQIYHLRIFYYVRRIMKNEESAEDVAQEVWLAVYKGIGKIRNPAAFPAWIYRITRNIAFQHARGRVRDFKMRVSMEELSEIAQEIDGMQFEDSEAVHKALEDLKPLHREVLMLRYLEGMDYQAIAQVMESSVGTVRSRLHYAKTAMQRILGGIRQS